MDAIKFPAHQCGLHLEHNAHRNYYETAEEWQRNSVDRSSDHEGLYAWKDEAAMERAIATNEVWTLQWYPRTPVSFYAIAAPTLEELLAFAAEVDKMEETP